MLFFPERKKKVLPNCSSNLSKRPMLPNLSMLVATKTNPPLAEGELTEDEDDYDVVLYKQIDAIKRHFKLGYLTERRDVIDKANDKAKAASGFEAVGTLEEQIRQIYNYVVGPMQEKHRVAKGVSLNDFAMNELTLTNSSEALHTLTNR